MFFFFLLYCHIFILTIGTWESVISSDETTAIRVNSLRPTGDFLNLACPFGREKSTLGPRFHQIDLHPLVKSKVKYQIGSQNASSFFLVRKLRKSSQYLQMHTSQPPKNDVICGSPLRKTKEPKSIWRFWKKTVNKLSVKKKSRFGHVVWKKNQHCMFFLKWATKKNIFYFPWNPGYLIGITIIIPTLLGSITPSIPSTTRGPFFIAQMTSFAREFHTVTKSW